VHSTGCLGLSILNSMGIYGGCEGDMPSLLSMVILGNLTGEDLFMCNPSRFDTKEGFATFAHCTLPVTMPDRFTLNTHFESGIGVAVQGSFDPGSCTIFKCAGDLSRYFVKEARILETSFSDMLCRTQVRVGIDDFSYFLTDPIGNHHIIAKGNHAAEAEAFFDLLRA
jgi:L-fucose isomerase-like protein